MNAEIFHAYGAILARVKRRLEDGAGLSPGLVCKQGLWRDSYVLKLQKPNWTNDPMDQLENKSGIFFSIWVDSESAGLHRACYNIHALKLRHLKGYSIASRDFAEDFRRRFAAFAATWPNVSLDHGPLTLMQGYTQLSLDGAEEHLSHLAESFMPVSNLIDHLLEARLSSPAGKRG